jgi:hypothetical protein
MYLMHKKIIITPRGKALRNKPMSFFIKNLIDRMKMQMQMAINDIN